MPIDIGRVTWLGLTGCENISNGYIAVVATKFDVRLQMDEIENIVCTVGEWDPHERGTPTCSSYLTIPSNLTLLCFFYFNSFHPFLLLMILKLQKQSAFKEDLILSSKYQNVPAPPVKWKVWNKNFCRFHSSTQFRRT